MTNTDTSNRSAADTAYLEWNSRVALFWLTEPFSDAALYLTITPRGLASAARECDGIVLSPDEAETSFLEAVRHFYKNRIIDTGRELDALRGQDKNGIPLCLAFLALSVLAVHHMHRDDVNLSTAFYPRLIQLLNLGERNKRPVGFKEQLFEELWLSVRAWTEAKSTGPLFIPEPQYRQYENYPKAHSVLRQVDLARLPDFFRWARYAPESQVAPTQLTADLMSWIADKAPFTRQGLAACKDSRLPAVAQEVAQELRAWDGGGRDEEGRSVASVELTLELVRGMPRLYFLARKPPGFPEVFDDGQHHFESLEGWYDPVPVPANEGDALFEGFEWVSTNTDHPVVLRRAGAKVISFVRSEDSAGYGSRRRLLAGVECAILYHASAAIDVEARISDLSKARPKPSKGAPGIPRDWLVMAPIRVEQRTDSVPGLEALEVDAVIDFLAVGGLRVGSRSAWLRGAAPILQVSGVQDSVEVNKRTVKVTGGVVGWSAMVREPGLYSVRAARAHRNIEIVEPRIADELPSLLIDASKARHVLALPIGRWLIVGADPAEVHSHEASTYEVTEVPFRPIWALPTNATLGAIIFLASGELSPARRPGNEMSDKAWASAFASLEPLRVPIVALSETDKAAAAESWARFSRAAKAGGGRR